MLRTEDRGEPRAPVDTQMVDDGQKVVIDRGWITDEADALAIQIGGGEKAFGAELDPHRRRLFHTSSITGPEALDAPTCLYRQRLIDYAPLVASRACFARAESRSSLKPDSFPSTPLPSDEQPPSGAADPE